MVNFVKVLFRAFLALGLTFTISAVIIFFSMKYIICAPTPSVSCIFSMYLGTPVYALISTAILGIPVYLFLKNFSTGTNIIKSYYKPTLIVIASIAIITYLLLNFLK